MLSSFLFAKDVHKKGLDMVYYKNTRDEPPMD